MRQPEIRFSEEQALLLDSAVSFAHARSQAEPIRALISSDIGYSRQAWDQMVDLGWTGLNVPELYGGSGLPIGYATPVLESLGRHLLPSPLAGTLAATEALLRHGSEVLKAATLPLLAKGGVATLAVSEPDAGWSHAPPRCAARRDGAFYVLSGMKRFVPYALSADIVLVSLLCEGETRWAAVPRSALPRDAVTREMPVDETQRTFRIDLSGIILEPDWLLAATPHDSIEGVRRAATLLICAEMSGGLQGALDLIVDYLRNRRQFGRLIGSFQGLKHPTAELFAQSEMARSLLYGAATHLEDDLGDSLVRMAKAKLSDLFVHAGDRAVQFHGGLGFTYECDAGLFLRRALWMRSQFGDAHHHRLALEQAIFSRARAA